MFQSDCLVANMAKPSWCLLVMVMYFMPAALASATHSAASNSVGLNCGGQLLVFGDGHLAVVHHPFAVAEHAVDAPVDEHAELGVAKPFLLGGFRGRSRHLGARGSE